MFFFSLSLKRHKIATKQKWNIVNCGHEKREMKKTGKKLQQKDDVKCDVICLNYPTNCVFTKELHSI